MIPIFSLSYIKHKIVFLTSVGLLVTLKGPDLLNVQKIYTNKILGEQNVREKVHNFVKNVIATKFCIYSNIL